MPKLLFLNLNLYKNDILSFKNKLNKSEYDYYRSDEIHPIESLNDSNTEQNIGKFNPHSFTNVNTEKSFNTTNTSTHNTDHNYNKKIYNLSGMNHLSENKLTYNLTGNGLIETYNIYTLNNKFNMNNVDKDFLNMFNNSYKCNSVCWWCCYDLEIETVPIPLPIKYDEIKRTFSCKGIFCSFNCSLAYSLHHKVGSQMLINYLHKKMTNLDMNKNNIIPAPPRELLTIFGGPIEITAFRNSSKKYNVYDLVEYPVIFVHSELKEKAIKNIMAPNLSETLNKHKESINVNEKKSWYQISEESQTQTNPYFSDNKEKDQNLDSNSKNTKSTKSSKKFKKPVSILSMIQSE